MDNKPKDKPTQEAGSFVKKLKCEVKYTYLASKSLHELQDALVYCI